MKVLLVLGALLLAVIVAVMIGNAVNDNTGARVGFAGERVATADPPSHAGAKEGTSCADEQQLRRIIREELAAQLTTNAASVIPQGTDSDSPAARSREADNSRQLASVSEQLDQYILAGSISPAEMAVLQIEMGKLDKTGQHEMLKKLMRAMNSGALAGNP
jgi:hypothetical protein